MMKFAEHLSKKQIQRVNQLRNVLEKENNKEKVMIEQTKKVKVSETLSRRDLEELMGTRRETFKRVRGAVRRK